MARLITSGFEFGEVANSEPFTTSTTAPTADSAGNARTGTWACKVSSSAAFTYVIATVAPATTVTVFAKAAFKVTALPPAGTTLTIMSALTGAGGVQAMLVLTETGALQLTDGAGSQIGSNSAETVSAGTYFVAEMAIVVDTSNSANALAQARLNGTSFASGSAISNPTTLTGSFRIGAISQSGAAIATVVPLYVDDVAVNDSSGVNQNSWPGSEKIVLLKPASDNAVGTGWTLGTGTAAGGVAFDAVNNTPPTGVADLTAGSDPKQIRNATSNANVNYDANLTTYTAAGIGAEDTINVLVPMVATGAPVVTSAKAGTFGIASNPAIANVSLGAGGTAGAFWSGVAAGTYPTGWKWSFGTTTYAPSVTRGTAPVARITQVTASTRIADVCAMGMYVGYTPARSVHVRQNRAPRAAATLISPSGMYT